MHLTQADLQSEAKLPVNTKKLMFISLGIRTHLKKLEKTNKNMWYLSTSFERSDKVKYLGVHFDKQMQWKYQIKNIIRKVNFKIRQIVNAIC